MNLLPEAKILSKQEGKFYIDFKTSIMLDCEYDNFEVAEFLQSELKKSISITLQIKKIYKNSTEGSINCIVFEFDSSINKKEQYRLTIKHDKIIISANCSSGFLYGCATLIQICKLQKNNIDCLVIEDEPSFNNRAYLLDVSRGRVPKMSSLFELVDILALYKINELQLNMESSFRFDGLSELWSQYDMLTPQNILELDRYCLKRGVELVPCIATFGHLYDLLRSDSFKKYCELDVNFGNPFTWYYKMRHHIVNVSDPNSFEMIKYFLEQYIPLFSSERINICCDETFDLGKGKSLELAKTKSYGNMYYDYVNKLVDYLHDKGKQVIMWADIILNHPEHLDKLNKEVTCLNWHYNYGAKEETIKLFEQNNLKQYVCSSVSAYSRLVPEYNMSFTNIKEMATLGYKHGAIGFLNTDWGDTGHVNMPSLSKPSIIYGASMSWNINDTRDFDTIDRAISQIEFNDKDQVIVGLMRELSMEDVIIFNDLTFFRDYLVYGLEYRETWGCLYEGAKDRIMNATEEQLVSAIKRCEQILLDINLNSSNQTQEFSLSARGVSLMLKTVLAIKKYEYKQKIDINENLWELAENLEYWLSDYCTCWRETSLESELQRIKEFIKHICSILRNY